MKAYLAGGWFSPEQEEEHTRIYNILKPRLEVFNPKLAGIVGNNSTQDRMTNVLCGNLKAIDESQIVVVITDRKDMGTIWEAGYAYACKKPIIYYCETLGDRPFNLMLAKTGLVARNEDELMTLLSKIDTYEFKSYHDYTGTIE